MKTGFLGKNELEFHLISPWVELEKNLAVLLSNLRVSSYEIDLKKWELNLPLLLLLIVKFIIYGYTNDQEQ